MVKKTKPLQKHKITKILIILILFESKKKHLSKKEILSLIRKEGEVEFKSQTALNPHLRELKKEKLIKSLGILKNVTYTLSDNWRTWEYLDLLDNYFKISENKGKKKLDLIDLLSEHYPRLDVRAFFAIKNEALLYKELQKYKPDSSKRKERLLRWFTDGVYNGVLELARFHAENSAYKKISKDLDQIKTLDELKKHNDLLKEHSTTHPYLLLESVSKERNNLGELIEDEKTPEKIKLPSIYVVNRADEEIERMGYGYRNGTEFTILCNKKKKEK